MHDGPDFMLVLDEATGNSSYQQLWHLDPSLTVTSANAGGAIATAPAVAATATSRAVPATALHLVRIPVSGPGTAGPTTVVKGQTNPYQGWVSRQALQRTPAPVIIMNSDGTGSGLDTTMLTLITATAPGTPVSATAIATASGSYTVTVRIGKTTTSVML